MSPSDSAATRVIVAGTNTGGEKWWQLPLENEYFEQLKSKVRHCPSKSTVCSDVLDLLPGLFGIQTRHPAAYCSAARTCMRTNLRYTVSCCATTQLCCLLMVPSSERCTESIHAECAHRGPDPTLHVRRASCMIRGVHASAVCHMLALRAPAVLLACAGGPVLLLRECLSRFPACLFTSACLSTVSLCSVQPCVVCR